MEGTIFERRLAQGGVAALLLAQVFLAAFAVPGISGQVAAVGPNDLTLHLTFKVNNSDTLHYPNEQRIIPLVQVELWDAGLLSDRKLATAWTDDFGKVTFDVPNCDAPPLCTSFLDPYVIAFANASRAVGGGDRAVIAWVNHTTSGTDPQTHTFRHDFVLDMASGSYTLDVYPATADEGAPFYVLERAVFAWNATENGFSLEVAATEFIWDPNTPSPCPSDPSCFLNPGNGPKRVYINASGHQDHWDADVVLKAYGERVLFQLYAGNWSFIPSGGLGFERAYGNCTSASEAWVVGWGIFYQAWVKQSAQYRDGKLSDAGWRANRSIEDFWWNVEGACRAASVAAALWDVYDTVNDSGNRTGNDTISAGLASLVDVVKRCRPNNPPVRRITSYGEFSTCWATLTGPAPPNQSEFRNLSEFHNMNRSLLGDWLKSIVFGQVSGQAQLQNVSNVTGVEVLPFGVPLTTPGHAAITTEWLHRNDPLAAIVQLNTFQVVQCCAPLSDADKTEIRDLFQSYAFLNNHSNVKLVIGANEPVHKKSWPTEQDMIDRVAFEYEAWHNVSALPFCHKFNLLHNPTVGADNQSLGNLSVMRALWNTTQDAICYDWYRGSPDTEDDFRFLREEANNRSMAVHVLESSLTQTPDNNSSANLDRFARAIHTGRGDTFSVFHLAYRCPVVGGERRLPVGDRHLLGLRRRRSEGRASAVQLHVLVVQVGGW